MAISWVWQVKHETRGAENLSSEQLEMLQKFQHILTVFDELSREPQPVPKRKVQSGRKGEDQNGKTVDVIGKGGEEKDEWPGG